jgi:hypothetical protein
MPVAFRPGALRALLIIPLLCLAAPLRAAETDELRAQIEALKADYQARISALEERLSRLEAQGAATTPTAGAAAAALAASAPPLSPLPPPPAAGGTSGGQGAFNPSVSVILSGRYTQASQDPGSYGIAGFMPPGGEVGPGPRGFNLGESELTFAANVDPYFNATLTTAIGSDNSIAVEEAFARTSALPSGLTLKLGRFFSGIGYLNEVHGHAWDFVDQPLAYQALFGGQLAQDGAQLKWVAPTDVFLEFGAEAGSGAEFPGTRPGHNGLNGYALLAHAGDDIGDAASWRAGVSWYGAHAQARAFDEPLADGGTALDAFTGRSGTFIADATFKWSPHGNPTVNSLKLQAEYLERRENGSLAAGALQQAYTGGYSSRQSGWYVQGVYQFLPRWRAAVRYDALDSGHPWIGLVAAGLEPANRFPLLAHATPSRATLGIDWNPSEFTRLRAQYARDAARPQARDDEFMLQYLYSIGAHGAHKY